MSVSRRTLLAAVAALTTWTGTAMAQLPAGLIMPNDRGIDSRLEDRTALRLASFAEAAPKGSRFEDDVAAPVVPEPAVKMPAPPSQIKSPAPAAPATLPSVKAPAAIKPAAPAKEQPAETPSPSAVQPLPKAVPAPVAKPIPKAPAAPPAPLETNAPAAPYIELDKPAVVTQPSAPLQSPPAPAMVGEIAPGEVLPACPAPGCRHACDQPLFAMPQPRMLQDHGIVLGGWIDQGITYNAYPSADGYNGVVTFNDRNGEWMVNQINVFLNKEVNNGGCGWDLGGRVDVLSGTDARFSQAVGLELDWNQLEHYQLALPQFYADVAYDAWKVRAGHFYAPMGYEVVPSPDNFFYSHAYTFQYGEPFTFTGLLVSREVTERVSINGGFHRGWDTFRDLDGRDNLGFMGGFTWKSCNDRFSLAFEITTGEQGIDNNTFLYSLVGKAKLTDRLTWVVQHDYGQSSGGLAQNQLPNVINTAEWYGLNQYWLYEINCKWSAGMRFEWFRDNNGTRVHGLGRNNYVAGEDFMGNFYELTVGLNWKPRKGVIFRPELRYDWYSGDVPGLPLPFPPTSVVNTINGPTSSGTRSDQFLLGCDLILTF